MCPYKLTRYAKHFLFNRNPSTLNLSTIKKNYVIPNITKRIKDAESKMAGRTGRQTFFLLNTFQMR